MGIACWSISNKVAKLTKESNLATNTLKLCSIAKKPYLKQFEFDVGC